MKKWIACFAVLLVLVLCVGCSGKTTLNGTDISAYTIVYAPDAPDYCQRAATYIQRQILSRTGVELPVCEAADTVYDHEIVVGETNRGISQQLDAETENVEFALLADENHIAMEGDYFIIAAAAYYFVENYIPGEKFKSTVPAEVTVCQPITEKAKNFMFLIGDGMGANHTRLIGAEDTDTWKGKDGEDIFYGYYLPYQGMIRTDSLSGVTDSAAGATALACGYKTVNGYVGRDQDLNDVQSLTELAASMNRATAVMSTDQMNGATPAGFSAHANDRGDTDAILACQRDMMSRNGTVFECGLHSTEKYETYIQEVLSELEGSEQGFFLMYEEGYIDKFSHKMQLEGAFDSMLRFNQAIGVFMEYAFYHPDTFLLITADHETGGLMPDQENGYAFHTESHTAADVPIFAYGQGAETFRDYYEENNEVPKVIAALWGVPNFGDNG